MPWMDFARILAIAIVALVPVIIIHLLFHLNIWIAVIISVIYLIVVYYVEIKKSLFIVDRSVLMMMIRKLFKKQVK